MLAQRGSFNIYDFAGHSNFNCSLPNLTFSGKLVYAAADSSFIRVEVDTGAPAPSWTAYFPDGTKVAGAVAVTAQPHATDSDASVLTDRHGNQIMVSGACVIGSACTEQLVDNLVIPGSSRAVTITYASKASGTWTDQISWTGPNGALSASVTWNTGTPYALPYYCRANSTTVDQTNICTLTQQDSRVSFVQLPPGTTGGTSFAYKMGYGAVSPSTYTWGELHTLEMCSGTSAASCQTQWGTQYVYQFDNEASLLSTTPHASASRAPGVSINPVSSKTLTYTETLLSSVPISETTKYYMLVPTSIYSYPATSSGSTRSVTAAEVDYPDGSYSETLVSQTCPGNQTLRDLCVGLPYKTINRDSSVTEIVLGIQHGRTWSTRRGVLQPLPPVAIRRSARFPAI